MPRFQSWLHGERGPQRPSRRLRGCSLVLEPLEDRCLLSAGNLDPLFVSLAAAGFRPSAYELLGRVSAWAAAPADFSVSPRSLAATDGQRLFALTSESRLLVLDAAPDNLLRPESQTRFQGQPVALYLAGTQITVVSTAVVAAHDGTVVPRVFVTEFDVGQLERPIAEQETLLAGAYLGSWLSGSRLDVLVYNDSATHVPSILDPPSAASGNNILPFAVHWLDGDRIQLATGSLFSQPLESTTAILSLVSFDAAGAQFGPVTTVNAAVARDAGLAQPVPPQWPLQQELLVQGLRVVVTPATLQAYSASQPERLLAVVSLITGSIAVGSADGTRQTPGSNAIVPITLANAPHGRNDLFFSQAVTVTTLQTSQGTSRSWSIAVSLDPTFGGVAFFTAGFNLGGTNGDQGAIKPDGKVVVAGAAFGVIVWVPPRADAAAAPPALPSSTLPRAPAANGLSWSPVQEMLPTLTIAVAIVEMAPSAPAVRPEENVPHLEPNFVRMLLGVPNRVQLGAAGAALASPHDNAWSALALGAAANLGARFATISSGHQLSAEEAEAQPANRRLGGSLTQRFALEVIADRGDRLTATNMIANRWAPPDAAAAIDAVLGGDVAPPTARIETVARAQSGPVAAVSTDGPAPKTQTPNLFEMLRNVAAVVAMWTMSQFFHGGAFGDRRPATPR